MDKLDAYLYLDSILHGVNKSPLLYLSTNYDLFEGKQMMLAKRGNGKRKKVKKGGAHAFTRFDQYYDD